MKSGKLKEPIKDVEYLHIIKNGKVVLKLTGDEVNGKRKVELNELIGEQIGEGTYRYSVKFYNDETARTGTIRGFTSKNKVVKDDSESIVLKQLELLQKKIDDKSNNNFDVNLLLNMKEQAYKIQIDFFKSRIELLERENNELKKQIESSGTGANLETFLPLIEALIRK